MNFVTRVTVSETDGEGENSILGSFNLTAEPIRHVRANAHTEGEAPKTGANFVLRGARHARASCPET